MKLLFYGNCQTLAAQAALTANNPKMKSEYAGNSVRVTHYDPERTEKLMNWCDYIITQPVMNDSNPDHYQRLQERFGDRVLFMPYVFCDGLFSMSHAPAARSKVRSGVIGEEVVIKELRRHGFNKTLFRYRNGLIKFDHDKRFAANLTELHRREEVCDIRIADFLEQNYRKQPMMITHNHPMPVVINLIGKQIAERTGLDYTDITRENPLDFAAITLPEFDTLTTPYTVRDLGLEYDYDLQWTRKGRKLISMIAKSIGIDETAQPQKSGLRKIASRLKNGQPL